MTVCCHGLSWLAVIEKDPDSRVIEQGGCAGPIPSHWLAGGHVVRSGCRLCVSVLLLAGRMLTWRYIAVAPDVYHLSDVTVCLRFWELEVVEESCNLEEDHRKLRRWKTEYPKG